MPEVAAKQLTRAHIPLLQELLKSGQLPYQDCADPAHQYFGVFENGDLIAAGGLESFARVGLIRSVVVASEFRSQGLALLIIEQIQKTAIAQGVEALYLLTESAAEYFKAQGYLLIDRDDVPPSIRATEQFAALCPASADCMRRILKPDELFAASD